MGSERYYGNPNRSGSRFSPEKDKEIHNKLTKILKDIQDIRDQFDDEALTDEQE